MVSGGKAVGHAAEGIIATMVKDLFRVVARDAEKGAAKDVTRTVEKDLAKNLEKDLEKDLGKDATKPFDKRALCGDPVDVATGEVVMRQVDVELDGVLPLLLARTHASSYRRGRWFGPSWSSTLDQRLEVDAAGVCFVADEAMVLYYPRPVLGEQVLPEEGPQWPLALTADGGYTVTQPEHGRTLRFARRGDGMVRVLASIGDRNGNRIDVDYGPDGTPSGVRHTGGYHIAVDTTGGLVTGLRLRDSGAGEGVVLVRFGYDTDARLVEVVNSSGLPLRLTYDTEGRLTGWQDRNGVWYRYTYDEQGRCVRATGRDGYLNATFRYDDDRMVTVVTNSLGHATSYHLDERGRVVREVDPLGHATLSEWDSRDRLLSRTDPLGRTTRYTYDDAGNLVALTRPDGARTRIEYDPNRRPVAVTDPDGAVWRQGFDERGNLVAVTDPAGATTRYAYDEHGAMTGVTNALGEVRRIENDPAGLPVAVTDPLGATTRLARDAFGRVTAATDPLGHTTTFGWTVEGRLAFRRRPDGATERWVYDGEGNVIEYVDAAGNTTRTEYTAFDLPAAQTGPDGARVTYSYDTELRLVAVTNPQGLVWRYGYDPVGNLVRETDFNSRTLTYTYDPAGQLVHCVNGAGQSVRFTYDEVGNVVERRSDQTVTTFGYDRAGRLVRATSPVADLAFDRDPLGRVVAETCNGRTVESTYDLVGRRVRRRTPSGMDSVWEYDASSRPVTLTTGGQVVRFGYDAAGREVARRVGADVLLTQTWNPDHLLRSQALTVGGLDPAAPPAARQSRLLQHRAYTYRPDGYPVAVDDHLAGSRRFDLDPAGRITAVHGPNRTERYSYDLAGNITHAAWPVSVPAGQPGQPGPAGAGARGDREYAGTLLRRAGNVRYEHDAQGRVVLRQGRTLSGRSDTWHYTWDAEDRLVGVTTPDGTRWRYLYDPLGRRIAKQRLTPDGSGVAEQVDFTWDGMVLAEQTHTTPHRGGPAGPWATVTAWDWVPGTFRPVTQTERARRRDAPQEWVDQRFYSIVTDLVGMPSELLDEAGNLAWHRGTSLWGTTLFQSTGGAYCPLRFPGQYHDPETRLDYNVFRYYDPEAARYSSADPLGLLAGMNPHVYPENPARSFDPLGLVDCKRAQKLANRVIDRASDGKIRRSPDYHGRLSHDLEQQILSTPDAVYVSSGTAGRLTFRKGEDVVVVEGFNGPGGASGAGQVLTSYGPSGPRGASGAAIFGGSPSDPGLPITHDALVNGKVPTPDGGFLPPAIQILP